jgi:hypothetical protein
VLPGGRVGGHVEFREWLEDLQHRYVQLSREMDTITECSLPKPEGSAEGTIPE